MNIFCQDGELDIELKEGDKIEFSGKVKGFTATEAGVISIELDSIEIEEIEKEKNTLKKSYDKAVANRTHVEQPIHAP